MDQPRVGVFGGSFNPVHSGHVRLAIETREILGLDRVELVPAAVPPHKDLQGLLPFELRCRLIQMAVSPVSGLHCNVMEGQRKGPSYTGDTLLELARSEPTARLFFLLGVPDLLTLPLWKHGLELIRHADFVAVARQSMALEETRKFIHRHWVRAAAPQQRTTAYGPIWEWRLGPDAGRILLIHPPFMDISSTMIREYWRQGRDLRFLVPDDVLAEMARRHDLLREFWQTSIPK